MRGDMGMTQSAICSSGVCFASSHFTGKERDSESGNDYFGAKYCASAMGRWLSPDWSAKEEPVPYADLEDPRSLNLYLYMQNNPLGGVDADGHLPPWIAQRIQQTKQWAADHPRTTMAVGGALLVRISHEEINDCIH